MPLMSQEQKLLPFLTVILDAPMRNPPRRTTPTPSTKFAFKLATRTYPVRPLLFYLPVKLRQSLGSFVVEPSPLQSQFTNVTRKTQKRTLADATFRTRRGAISVDLTTAGDVNRVPKATVVASSRRGDITINVVSVQVTIRADCL